MAFGLGRKRILTVGGDGVALFGPTARGIEREAMIAWDAPGFDQQLVEALTEQNRGAAVRILFDGADQNYRKEENVPKLGPMDRPRYIKRKLDAAFPNYPVRISIPIQPPKKVDKNAPKEQPSYLFAAIMDTERLDRISACIMEAGVPIAGFGLLPIESSGLVAALSDKLFGKLGKKSRWAVLIGQQETGGLRQVVVRNGNLAIARTTPTSEAGTHGPGWAEEVVREFRATLNYISRFGYTADEGLDVMVICNNPDKQLFDAKALPVTNFRCMTVTEAMAIIGSRGISLGDAGFSDAVHAAWMEAKRALDAPAVVPSITRIMMPRLGARIGSVLLVLTALGMGWMAFEDYQIYADTQENILLQQNQKKRLDEEYAEKAKMFDSLPVKPATARATLAVRDFVARTSYSVAPILNLLRKTLGNDIRLSQLTYDHDVGDILKPAGPPGTPPAQGRGKIRLSIKFSILGSPTLEEKVTRAEKLAEALRAAFVGYDVRITNQFGRISRTGRFEGATGKGPAGGPNAPPQQQEDSAEIELEGAPL